MSLQTTPTGDRIHIGFFGRRNAGKSSLVNAFTGQQLSVVSDVRGTTTDPVRKAMELLPLGPVMIVDTPGIDDEGALGALRIEKTRQELNRCDIALLVTDATQPLQAADLDLIALFKTKRVPYLIVRNKCDLLPSLPKEPEEDTVYTSARKHFQIEELKVRVSQLTGSHAPAESPILGDLISTGDLVILVTPIDASAPKGRLILPQQQTIRDLLDHHATALTVQPAELKSLLRSLNRPPRLVVTDSQVFQRVAQEIPPEIPLTSFSILFARHKGDLAQLVQGAAALDTIRTGDRILISEGCTHHRQCGDIGTVKLPYWIREHTKAEPEFTFTSGREFPEELSSYRLIVHCGGCMLHQREMAWRQKSAAAQGIPMTNYGMLIAKIHGILPRALALFPEAAILPDSSAK